MLSTGRSNHGRHIDDEKLWSPQGELYETELTISEDEKRQFLSDIASYVKKALEANGQTVNRILLTTDFEKKANEVIGQGQPGMPGILRGATIT